ncbi:hypothetical protein EU527_02550 [Candidatus Thorarchaeota archaeon]|nr:MAG: hypothetical protein EU527_02550 [Candidatus Thorarchaeota archaeon]
MNRFILTILLAVLILGIYDLQVPISPTSSIVSDTVVLTDLASPSSDAGIVIPNNPYIIIELESSIIPARGHDWSSLLESMGITNVLLSTSELLSNPSLIRNVPALIIDGSLGSSYGNEVPPDVIELLIRTDAPLVLTGNSVWLLHRLTDRCLPSSAAPVATALSIEPEYSGAVFLTRPNSLTIGNALSNEIGLMLPLYESQTPMSRLVNLTGSSDSTIAPLKYDSYPLDLFLFAYENPSMLTATGVDLFENLIAFSASVRETSTANAIASLQTSVGDALAGGFRYMHSPSISSTYYAVHSANSLLEGSEWTSWVIENSPLVRDILNTLLLDYGSETGFKNSETEASVNCRSTAQGLYLIIAMGLSSEFAVSEIVSYLSSRQDIDGGFENHITTTYHVTEALYLSSNLAAIDTNELELWLRDLVIDGTKTSNPDLWGAIGPNPTSTSARTNYAAEYLRSLSFIGKAHPDPSKMTSWILTRTSNGDGSFRNSIGLDEEVITGTASALTCMQILGTLNEANRTASLNWLTNNQLASGGFGMKSQSNDIVAKVRESSRVALCLNVLSETAESLTEGITQFIDLITTETSFEAMDLLPSLMWTHYLLDASRLVHASPVVDLHLAAEYLNGFETMTIYPYWSNLTTTSAPEYTTTQYRTKSVWVQYFGVSSAKSLGIELSPSVVSDILLFITQSQYATGHYRPTSFIGTAHMQHSVAAIETLYLLDELDTITYRSALETSILSEYQSGTWSSVGWTLEPFAGSKAMIDYLSTRAALRLDLLTPTMASEIASAIEARVQYNDLLALSMDIATLALLQCSDLSSSVDIVDTSMVLSALRSSPFIDGWFNTTKPWQPLYTQSVLKMVSILGLRLQLSDISGTVLTASSNLIAELGSMLDISVAITSDIDVHSVVVNAFDSSILFQNVGDLDTLTLMIPSDSDLLGHWNISIMVIDWGLSRDFHRLSVTIEGGLQGSLNLETPIVKMGEFINGTALWSLASGGDVGLSQVTIRLGEFPTYYQWNYEETSPFSFSIPSDDFAAGTYNLTITIAVDHCESLILSDYVVIAEPNPTYIQALSELNGLVDDILCIDWSLHFQENGTIIPGQVVSISISDSYGTVIFSSELISSTTNCSFNWIPDMRGDFDFVLAFVGNNTLEESLAQGTICILEETDISWFSTGFHEQYSSILVTIQLTGQSGVYLDSYDIHVFGTAPSAETILDTIITTNGTGHVSFTIILSENGFYLLQAEFVEEGYLLGCSGSNSINSWSVSSLEIGGLTDEEPLGEMNTIWAQLVDSAENPIIGEQVVLRVLLLPTTIVSEQIIITNSSGFVIMQWEPSSVGEYKIEAIFNGTLSRSSAIGGFYVEVVVAVSLSISYYSSPEVGVPAWIQVLATDHLLNPISGLVITIIVQDPGGTVVYSNTSTTSGGITTFSWIPTVRGSNTIITTSEKQNWYQNSSSMSSVGVSETPLLVIDIPGEMIAPVTNSVMITLLDNALNPINGITLHALITLNGAILYDSSDITNDEGVIDLYLNFSEPGILFVQVDLASENWLLEVSIEADEIVLAATTISITVPGTPIEQGSTLGLVVALLDYLGNPLSDADVEITITWSNGTSIASYTRITDGSGQCVLAHTFNEVGDFLIEVHYGGYGLNASSYNLVTQRVFTTPNMQLLHNPSCIVGESTVFQVAITDSLGNYIVGRTVHLSIIQEGIVVFEAQTESINGLSIITWYPSKGGFAEITLLHVGNSYYLANSIASSLSVLELVSGTLDVSPSEIDLFDSTTFVYTLNTVSPTAGVTIRFEVLGMDLVPVWIMDAMTNSSGVASVDYTANEAHGVLHVNAGPVSEEFLIGGDTQEQLVVKTFCNVMVNLVPYPPAVNSIINISIAIDDDLGNLVSGISVTVSAYDPYGQQIKLGLWTNSIIVTVNNGIATVQFSPTLVGLHTITVTSSGSVSVHGFSSSTHHTIYSVTQLQLMLSTHDLEVGETLEVSARLVDHNGNPMVGRNVSFLLDGPGASMIGPIWLVTNSSGFCTWNVDIDDEGLWSLETAFVGLGVYLPASASENIDVKYGTVVELLLVTTEDIVAGINNAAFSILLEDSGGTPLEGFSVYYEVHHETLGLIIQGSLIQAGTEPMILTLSLTRMGFIILIVSFRGTSHYHASNAALELWVFGTTEVILDLPNKIDMANESSIIAWVEDEVSLVILLQELDIGIELEGPYGSVDLTNRTLWNENFIELFTATLPVGRYTLTVTIAPSSERIGCISIFEFDITSTITVEVDRDGISGIISSPHSLTFFLLNSLNDSVDELNVWVSLYDPFGREIYGNPLTTRTLLPSAENGVEISWTPTLTGEYRVLFDYEGDEFYCPSSIEVFVLVRYMSSVEIVAPSITEFGEILPLSITLNGAVGGLSAKTVTIIVSMNGLIEYEESVMTGSRGIVSHNIVGLMAGTHIISVFFLGSDTQAPCMSELLVDVTPIVVVVIDNERSLYVGRNCSLSFSLSILGTQSDWNGTLDAVLIDPTHEMIGNWSFMINPHSVLTIMFIPAIEGTYSLNLTVFGLPVIAKETCPLAVAVVHESLYLLLDAGNTPLIGGFGVLSVLGIIARKKMKSVVGSLPGEWKE